MNKVSSKNFQGFQLFGKSGVFLKVFSYTMLLLALMNLAAVGLFARQFLSFYRSEQRRQLSAAFEPMISAMSGKNADEIIEAALAFANSNQSFRFYIEESGGKVLFSTHDAENLSEDEEKQGQRIRFISMSRALGAEPERAFIFTGYGINSGIINYGDLVRRSFLALIIMLIIAIFGAVLFARKVTKPLEDEILRERVMEENQRLFFSAASHELKTPIAANRAMVEGMIAGIGDYTDHPKYLRECLKTLDAQGLLVSEILEIVKLSERKQLFERKQLSDKETAAAMAAPDLAELGNAVLAEYRPLAEQRGILIQGEFSSLRIRSDPKLLRRVLSNVMANAVQNTREAESIRIETKEENHGVVRLCILNTGAKIPEDVLPRLFDPFFRMDSARTKNGTRTGLGLAIVKKALDRMNFPFALENTPEGVLFWVDLPAIRKHKELF